MQTKTRLGTPLTVVLRVFQSQTTTSLLALLLSVGLHALMFLVIPSSRSKSAEREVVKIGVIPRRKEDVCLSTQMSGDPKTQIMEENTPNMTNPQRRRDLSAQRHSRWAKKTGKEEERSLESRMMANLQTTDILFVPADSGRESGKGQEPEMTNSGGSHANEPGDEPENRSDGLEVLSSLRKSYAMLVRKMLEERQSYPQEAVEQEIEGEVRVVIEIGNDGSVLSARLAHSSGYAELDRAILSSIKGIGKLPEPPGGSIVIAVPIVFRLEEERY